jgi:hypothetical protein
MAFAPKHLAQGADLDGEVAFLHGQPAPDLFQKLGLGHHAVPVGVKMRQNVEGARPEGHRRPVDQKLSRVGADIRRRGFIPLGYPWRDARPRKSCR